MSLVERMRRARETWASVEKWDFLVRRPTHYEAAQLRGAGAGEVLRACVVDWRNVLESDLVPGGAADALPFDADVLVEWLLDRPTLLAGVLSAITEAVVADVNRREGAKKN